jgi:hypothetical protein
VYVSCLKVTVCLSLIEYFTYLENTSSFLAILTIETGAKLTSEEKRLIVEGIIRTARKMMEKVTTEKSAKNRAKEWCKPHIQSKKSMTHDAILFNVLNQNQHLPARPRDFRLILSDGEKDIGQAELSDNLARLVNIYLLENKRGDFRFPRGKPKFNSHFARERRGRLSYYNQTALKVKIDEVLGDPESMKLINGALIASDELYKFLKYSFATSFYQMKENEEAFFNSFKYLGITREQIKLNNKTPGPWIPISNLSIDKLERLAGAYAHQTIKEDYKDGNGILYTIAALLYFGRAYE